MLERIRLRLQKRSHRDRHLFAHLSPWRSEALLLRRLLLNALTFVQSSRALRSSSSTLTKPFSAHTNPIANTNAAHSLPRYRAQFRSNASSRSLNKDTAALSCRPISFLLATEPATNLITSSHQLSPQTAPMSAPRSCARVPARITYGSGV